MEWEKRYVLCLTILAAWIETSRSQPTLDLGVGEGNDDMIDFPEGNPIGVHIVSLPHRFQATNPGGFIRFLRIGLSADNSSFLDENEFLYSLPCPPGSPCAQFTIESATGQDLFFSTANGIDNEEALLAVVARLFYFSSADEPRLFVDSKSNEIINRTITVEVSGNSAPFLTAKLSSIVNIIAINDNQPDLTVKGPSECVFKPQSSRQRRNADFPFPKKTFTVESIEYVNPTTSGSDVAPGFSIIVSLSEGRVFKDEIRILVYHGKEKLLGNQTAPTWHEGKLFLVFPKGVYRNGGPIDSKKVHVYLTTHQSHYCTNPWECQKGFCLSTGNPCQVAGPFKDGYVYSENSAESMLSPDQETTQLHSWWLTGIAFISLGPIFVSGITIGCLARRRK